MKLEEIRLRLISYGYHPDEVEYAIMEVLQYKSPMYLTSMDFKILNNMLQEKIDVARAERHKKKLLKEDSKYCVC